MARKPTPTHLILPSLFLLVLPQGALAGKIKCPKDTKYFKEKHDNKAQKAHGCKYVDGSKDGGYEEWNDQGQMIAQGGYEKDNPTGIWKRWYGTGQL
ncbi:MAG: hypothetical protein HN348_06225, partial [Proteobacteria bacterium]|nr:hypothetical protein [Pseudomonadota bacterium]